MCTDNFKITITLDFKMIYSLFDDATANELVKAIHLYPNYIPNCKKELWTYIESTLKKKEAVKQKLREKAKARWGKKNTTNVEASKKEEVDISAFKSKTLDEELEDTANKMKESVKEEVSPVAENLKESIKNDLEQKEKEWKLMEDATESLRKTGTKAQVETLLQKMQAWWKINRCDDLNPEFNYASNMLKNRLKDLHEEEKKAITNGFFTIKQEDINDLEEELKGYGV